MTVQERNFRSISGSLPPPFHSEASSQLQMEDLLDQTQPTKEKAKKEPVGYKEMSPSDLGLIKLDSVPDISEEALSIQKLSPTRNEIIASMRGMEGHFIYELYIHLARIYRTRLIGTLTIGNIREDLVNSISWPLPVEQKTIIDSALQSLLEKKLFNPNQIIKRRDFGEIMRPVREIWRDNHAFYLQRVESATKTKRKFKYIEGQVHKAAEIQSLWNSPSQIAYGEKIIRALTDKVYFPQESIPANRTYIENVKIAHIKFPRGQLVQLTCRPDFICAPDQINYTPGEPSGAVIFDSKFGMPWEEDTQVMRDERVLYQAIIWQSIFDHMDIVGPLEFRNLHPENVGFYYTVVNIEGDTPAIELQSGYLTQDEINAALNDIEERVEQWSVFYPYYKYIKDKKEKAVVMPYIPKTPIGTAAQTGY